ncbi:hypothetical protein ACYJ1Y_16190 [Natrialbaceae archaeon A-gly3]
MVTSTHDTADLEQTDRDLERLIEATENVNWRHVPNVSVDDVAKWNEKLRFARKCVRRDLE